MINKKSIRLAPTKDTLVRLFARSGNLCAFPGCNAVLVDEENDFIGQVCHIVGVNGERSEVEMSAEEKRHYDNLVLLCYAHHVKTDNITVYSVEAMKKIKRDHELKPYPSFHVPNDVLENIYKQLRSLSEEIKLVHNDTQDLKIDTATIIAMLGSLTSQSPERPVSPDNISREIELIESLKSGRQFFKAIEAFEELKKQRWQTLSDPEKYKVTANLGISYLQLNKDKEAADNLVECAVYAPENAKALSFAAIGHALQRNYISARQYIEKAIAKDKDSIFAYVALITIEKSNPIDETISKIPAHLLGDAEVSYALGIIERDNGNYEKAISWLQRSIDATTEDPGFTKGILASVIMQSIGDEFKLVSGQINASDRNKLNFAITLLTESWNELCNSDLKQSSGWILTNRGVAKQYLRDIKGAYEDTLLAYELNKSEYSTVRNLLFLALEVGKTDIAATLIEEIKILDSSGENMAKADLMKAQMKFNTGEEQAALKEIENLLDGKCEGALRELALGFLMDCYLKLGEKSMAINLVNRNIADFSTDLNSYLLAVGLYLRLDQREIARQQLDKAYAVWTDRASKSDTLRLAEYSLELQDFERSIDILVAIADPTSYSELSRALIKCYFEAGEPLKALDICKQITDNNGPIQYITEMQSYIYQSVEDFDNAVAVCLSHLNVYPDDLSITLSLCLLYTRKQESELLSERLNSINVNEITLPIYQSFQLASMLATARKVERCLELSYRTRQRYIGDWQAHKHYWSLISKLIQTGEPLLNISRVAVDSRVTLRFVDGEIRQYTIVGTAQQESDSLLPSEYVARQLLGKQKATTYVLNVEGHDREYEIVDLASKYVVASIQSMHLLATTFKNESGAITFDMGDTGNIRTDMKELFSFLDRAEETDETLATHYRAGEFTIAGYAQHRTMNEVAAWMRMISNPKFGVWCENIADPRGKELYAMLDNNVDIVLDLYSLLTYAQLDLLFQLEQLPNKKLIAHSTTEALFAHVTELRLMSGAPSYSLKKDKNQYYRLDIDPKDINKMIGHLEKLLEWSKHCCVTLPVNEALKINFHKKGEMDQVIGKTSIDSILIAKEHYGLLFTEELILRSIARNDHGVAGISSNSLLFYWQRKKLITKEMRIDKIVQLLALNYRFLTVDADILIKCLTMADYSVNQVFLAGLKSLERKCTSDSAETAVFQMLYRLYHEHETTNRPNIMTRVFDALIDGRSPWLILESLYDRIAGARGFSDVSKREICSFIETYLNKISPH